jgi:hypothetical protein
MVMLFCAMVANESTDSKALVWFKWALPGRQLLNWD